MVSVFRNLSFAALVGLGLLIGSAFTLAGAANAGDYIETDLTGGFTLAGPDDDVGAITGYKGADPTGGFMG